MQSDDIHVKLLYMEPCLLKFQNGDEVVALLYRKDDDPDAKILYLKQPLQIATELSNSTRLFIYFKRWLTFNAQEFVQIWTHDVLTIVQLPQSVGAEYLTRVAQIYQSGFVPEGNTATPASTPTPDSTPSSSVFETILNRLDEKKSTKQ